MKRAAKMMASGLLVTISLLGVLMSLIAIAETGVPLTCHGLSTH